MRDAIWNKFPHSDIPKEAQWGATKMMQGFQNKTPEEAVRELNVFSHVSRRLRGEITINMRADGVDKVKEDFPHYKGG